MKLKHQLLSVALFLCANAAFSQTQNVGIGTTTPNASAKLEIASTSSGLLIPRLTTGQRTAVASPATGLMVYDTDTNSFWFYTGTAWTELTANGWKTTGNAGTVDGTHFIGTTNSEPLNFRISNQNAGRIDLDGNAFFGYRAGTLATGSNDNIAIGRYALGNGTSGPANVAIGLRHWSITQQRIT